MEPAAIGAANASRPLPRSRPRSMMILTENHTLVDPRDLDGLVELASVAERSGFDAVMLSEHIALGPAADAGGLPPNPRMYAAPGNQDPSMPWPSTPILAAAISQATADLRIVLGALITPLRHPVALAKELATLDLLTAGRLVVQPTVSWHRQEYEALGVSYEHRGSILDEQLGALHALWKSSPASHHGAHYDFTDVFCEPKPRRSSGPVLWFGGQTLHSRLLDRLVRLGSGFHPFGSPSDDDLGRLRSAMQAAGRSFDELEMIGGTRATFAGHDDVADLDAAMRSFAEQWDRGFTTFCMKPSQHTDRLDEVGDICRRMVEHVNSLSSPVQ